METPRPGGPHAKNIDGNYTDLNIFWAREFEDHYVFDLRRPDDFFSGGEIKLYKAAGEVPDLARSSSVRLYGKRGFAVRGLDVDGEEVFYRPPEETLEGWWMDLLSSPDREGEVLFAYSPKPWRTILPGAPKEIGVTRKDLVVSTRGETRSFPLYGSLIAEPRFSWWSMLGAALMLLGLLALVFVEGPWSTPGSAAFLCCCVVASFLSRSEALHVGRGTNHTVKTRRKSYPLLGRDPELRAVLRAVHGYAQASRKRYRRELMTPTDEPPPPYAG